jgi:hypothetical protein
MTTGAKRRQRPAEQVAVAVIDPNGNVLPPQSPGNSQPGNLFTFVPVQLGDEGLRAGQVHPRIHHP